MSIHVKETLTFPDALVEVSFRDAEGNLCTLTCQSHDVPNAWDDAIDWLGFEGMDSELEELEEPL